MSIQPIDMQVMIHKSTEVNKTNNDVQKNNEQQQLFSSELDKTIQKEQQQVLNTNKSEEQIIEYGKGGNKGEYRGRKKNKNKQQEPEKSKKNKSSSIFDVSI